MDTLTLPPGALPSHQPGWLGLHCGEPTLEQEWARRLADLPLAGPVQLVLDQPRGFALWGWPWALLVHPAVVIVTYTDCPHYLRDLLDRHPAGLVFRPQGEREVRYALERVAQGESYMSSAPLRCLLGEREVLTLRERQVLQGVAAGYANDRIAAQLGISQRCVYNYVSQMQEKLGLHNRAQVALYYLGFLGLIQTWAQGQ